MTGWLCPKCGLSNAPWVAQCPCGPNIVVTSGATYECPHIWELSTGTAAGATCRKCGKWEPRKVT